MKTSPVPAKKAPAKLLPCKCPSPYQDKKYGKDKRVHNFAAKKAEWRCTVCGLVKTGLA